MVSRTKRFKGRRWATANVQPNVAIFETPPMASQENGPLRCGCIDNWCWNRRDKSHEVRLYGPKLRTAHFHPNWSNGTAGVRGTRVLNRGRYYWEIKVSQRIFGTSMMFGVGTKKARLHVDAFVNMLGEDGHGWGLSHKGFLWHNGEWRQYTNPFRENEATTVGILFDGYEGTLTYYKDGVCLGVAFTDLQLVQEELYPIVCSTAAKTEMSLGLMRREYLDLQDRCRAAIMTCVKNENDVIQLKLPNRIKAYLLEATGYCTGHDRPRRGAGISHQTFDARILCAAKSLTGAKGSCLYV